MCQPPEQPLSLTPREHEVLVLLYQGLTTKQIAKALGLSPNRVRNLQVQLRAKFGVNTRTEPILKVIELRRHYHHPLQP